MSGALASVLCAACVELTQLFAGLHPTSSDQTLLLGLRIERPEGYGILESQRGKPIVLPPAGYRTLAIHTRAGTAALDQGVPYLVIPEGAGFRYIGDATAARDETGPTSPDEAQRIADGTATPREYAYTALWRTSDANAIARSYATLRRRIETPDFGTTYLSRVVYATPHALCTEYSETHWRGGAHLFDAEESQLLEGRGVHFPKTALARFGRTALVHFANQVRDLLAPAPGEQALVPAQPDVAIDEYSDFVPWRSVIWKTDVTPCLLRERGMVFESAVVTLNGNVDHEFAFALPVRPAAHAIAPSNRAPLDFNAVLRLFPTALDVIVAPNDALVLIVLPTGIVGYDVVTGGQVLTEPLSNRGVVMAEWAEGADITRWSEHVTKLPRW